MEGTSHFALVAVLGIDSLKQAARKSRGVKFRGCINIKNFIKFLHSSISVYYEPAIFAKSSQMRIKRLPRKNCKAMDAVYE